MLIDFATKVTQQFVTNPPPKGGSLYAGMSVRYILTKVAQVPQEQLAQFAQE
ncbi:MAG: hypothetical protein IMZ64_13135 [Bacteroidetes bacterium]|jgi:hypothetical protein|nr:hypothetical protein [Bacteroidota bacterium]